MSQNSARKNLIDKIKNEIEKEEIISIEKVSSEDHKDKKNAIYLLYNDEKEVIYIGKCGKGDSTSVYDRIYGHGNGAHCNKKWFEYVKYIKFKEFPNLESDYLNRVERLMIYAYGQPIYNDGCITDDDCECILKNIKI